MGKYIVIFGILLLVIGLIFILTKMNRTIQGARSSINTMADMANMIANISKETQEDLTYQPKSVSGATQLYMRQIIKEYPEYHVEEANMAIQTFIKEYLEVKYGEKESFEISKVDTHVVSSIKIQESKTVSEVCIHNIAICGYSKSEHYATIRYQAAFGYTTTEHVETKADIEYTLRLTDRKLGIESLRCHNCGAPIEHTGSKRCAYCDAQIIVDTVMSWQFTSIKEYNYN